MSDVTDVTDVAGVGECHHMMFYRETSSKCPMLYCNTTCQWYCRESVDARCFGCDLRLFFFKSYSIYLSSNSKAVINVNTAEQLTCRNNCTMTVNAYKVRLISCTLGCTAIINVYFAREILCYDGCNATIHCHADTNIICPEGECNAQITRHHDFASFCRNTGFGDPGSSTTEQTLTTTTELGTTEERFSTTEPVTEYTGIIYIISNIVRK